MSRMFYEVASFSVATMQALFGLFNVSRSNKAHEVGILCDMQGIKWLEYVYHIHKMKDPPLKMSYYVPKQAQLYGCQKWAL